LLVLIKDIAWRRAAPGVAASTGERTTVLEGPCRTWREGAPSSTPQYNVTALIAVILRYSSCSSDFLGKVRIASIKPSCSRDMSARINASRVSLSTTMPPSCRSLSFTSWSIFYRFIILLRSNFRYCYFSFRSRLITFWYYSSRRLLSRASDRLWTRSRNFKIHGRSLIDTDYSSISFRGRRGSRSTRAARGREYINRIRSF
jgi:hypothetical protein